MRIVPGWSDGPSDHRNHKPQGNLRKPKNQEPRYYGNQETLKPVTMETNLNHNSVQRKPGNPRNKYYGNQFIKGRSEDTKDPEQLNMDRIARCQKAAGFIPPGDENML